jgi:hypothetical protein
MTAGLDMPEMGVPAYPAQETLPAPQPAAAVLRQAS